MAKKSSIEKNNRKKILVEKFRMKRLKAKKMLMNKQVSPDDRFTASQILASFPKSSSIVRVRNRCEVTGRPRAYYRKFGLSRNKLREYASRGLIPGLTKSSW